MSRLLYRVLNPVVSGLLRSPAHGLLSANTLLLEYRGRRSGRFFRTPVSYCERGGVLHCFAGRNHIWWRNLAVGEPVDVVLRGRRQTMTPTVNLGDRDMIAARLRDFLLAVPRDAPHSGVRLGAGGEPDAGGLAAAAARHVHVVLAAGPGARGRGDPAQPSR